MVNDLSLDPNWEQRLTDLAATKIAQLDAFCEELERRAIEVTEGNPEFQRQMFRWAFDFIISLYESIPPDKLPPEFPRIYPTWLRPLVGAKMGFREEALELADELADKVPLGTNKAQRDRILHLYDSRRELLADAVMLVASQNEEPAPRIQEGINTKAMPICVLLTLLQMIKGDDRLALNFDWLVAETHRAAVAILSSTHYVPALIFNQLPSEDGEIQLWRPEFKRNSGGRPTRTTQISEGEFREKYVEAYCEARNEAARDKGTLPTQESVAAAMGIGARTLRNYLKHLKLPWPPQV